MNTNHQMNYYDFSKSLSAEGNMTALIYGPNTSPSSDIPNLVSIYTSDDISDSTVEITFDAPLSEELYLGDLIGGFDFDSLANGDGWETDDRIVWRNTLLHSVQDGNTAYVKVFSYDDDEFYEVTDNISITGYYAKFPEITNLTYIPDNVTDNIELDFSSNLQFEYMPSVLKGVINGVETTICDNFEKGAGIESWHGTTNLTITEAMDVTLQCNMTDMEPYIYNTRLTIYGQDE